jgi:hypothetical protein
VRTDRAQLARFAFVILVGGSIQGCAPEFWNGFAQGLANSQRSSIAAGGTSGGSGSHKLMVFGGPGHGTYLGCLNCSEYANDSVFNEYGPHGSAYASASVFNQYSQFGGLYGAYSPCNPHASDPPVIVDENGAFYGRLTVNEFHSQATHNTDIQAWLERVVCK